MKAVAVLCAAVLVAGCSGAASTATSPLPEVNAATRTPAVAGRHGKGKLIIRIRVPKRQKRRGAHYISPSTRGMAFVFTGSSAFTRAIALTSTDPHCAGFPLTCTLAIALPAGGYALTADAYDKAPVNGTIPSSSKLLSTAKNVAVTIVAGKNNAFGVTLDGIPASFGFDGLSGTAGTPLTQQAFTVVVKDADGDAIIGTYLNPVTLADGDTSGTTSISTSGSDKPPVNELLSSSDAASLSYSGLAFTGAAISASAAGAKTGHGTFAPQLNPITPSALGAGVPVNLYGASSPASFTLTEIGWTNAPYSRTIAASPSSDCTNVATISPSAGTSFTATLVSGATTSGSCTVTFSDGAGQQLVVPIGYQWFAYTGSAQTFTVPDGVTQATVFAAGGQGGVGTSTSYGSGGSGGQGGTVIATIPVTAGDSLQVNVGGVGGGGGASTGGTGGFNGGGDGSYTSGAGGMSGAGGGGASDLRDGGTTITPIDYRIVVAGGGGGSGGAGSAGGDGGGTTGATAGSSGSGCAGGGGGTPTDGGGGGGCRQDPGTSGSLGAGAVGGSNSGGGGGGGGLYGGGSGGGYAGNYFPSGGGGGSSFVEGSATNVTDSQGGQTGNGYVVITW